ncbi:MAG TPA: cupredoxin domain-containing protein [Gemmatimonadaceae bacterium]|nr:cupredoxin domain-containing protein [Gemmatimonadaceae bacterium]
MSRLLIVAACAVCSSVVGAQNVTVRLSEWKVQMSSDTVPAGTVTLQVNNTGMMTHGLHVRGEGVDKGTRDIAARQAETLTLTLKPGTYEVFCPMSEGSHKQAGMTRKLVVTPADKAPPGA